MIDTAAPSDHSSIVGGSTAGRRIACPGSYQLEQKVPESVKRGSSADADEGTALHAAMAYILENDIVDANEVIGMEFGGDDSMGRLGYVITEEQAVHALQPCIEYFDKLIENMEAETGAGEACWLIEKRVEMPGIPGAFGTMDLLVYTAVRTAGLDWKFGRGVRVLALYPDDDAGDLLNPQGMFYLRGAMHSVPEAFGGIGNTDTTRPIDFHIVQPRARLSDEETDPNSVAPDITAKELEEFRMALIRAVAEATGKNPSIARGGHCRFAPCKAICPAWTGPALDLAKLKDAMDQRKASALGDVFDYGEALAAALDLIDMFEPWAKTVRDDAHVFVEEGGYVRDRKLVNKRAYRKWRDESATLDALREKGLPDKDIFETSMRSPAQVEKAMKTGRLGPLPEDLVTATSSGTTLARADDKREDVIPPGVVVANFQKIMQSLLPPDPRPE